MNGNAMNDDRARSELTDSGDDAVARLIARAGHRAAPPPSSEAMARQKALAEWRRVVRARRLRVRRRWIATAAAMAVAAGIAWQIAGSGRDAQPAQATIVAQASGEVRVADRDGIVRTVAGADRLHIGDSLRTGDDSGARIELGGKLAVRVGASTRVVWLNADRMSLENGALYIDSGPDHARLGIDTPHGAVTHLGTRYSVASSDEALVVRVRDGRVAVDSNGQHLIAMAREELSVNRSGDVARSEIPGYGEHWGWADALARPIDIENLPLADFLRWAAHETGREVVFESERAGEAARRTILHGSVAGLSPEDSVEAVLSTTDFAVRLQDGELRVSLPPD